MKTEKLITALLLMLPGLSWGGPATCDTGYRMDGMGYCVHVTVPEPGILPLLAVGGIVMVAVKFMRRKK